MLAPIFGRLAAPASPARAVADGIFLGFLPIVLVNAWFVTPEDQPG
jgi:hypothetical protein